MNGTQWLTSIWKRTEQKSCRKSSAVPSQGDNDPMSHKFHTGQLVEFRPKKGSPVSSARGACEILKQLPERDGELAISDQKRS